MVSTSQHGFQQEKKVSKKFVKMLWVPINGRTRVKTWSQYGFDRKTRETVVAGSFTIKNDLTRRIADLKKRKKKLKKSWKFCGLHIHHRQIHAHEWSNEMNSRLKTGCEHDFPIAGDETWLSHSVEQNCSGKMKISMLICLTLLNVKTALPLKIGM